MVKNPPAMQVTQVRSLDQEDPLEKGMATQFSILAWRILWTVVYGVAKSQRQLGNFHFQFHTHTHTHIYTYIHMGFPGGTVVRICLPMQEMQETQVQSLGQEDPLVKEIATHSSILG